MSAAKAVLYGAIGLSAVKVAVGSGSSGGLEGDDREGARLAGRPMAGRRRRPGGHRLRPARWSVRGWTEKFAEGLETESLVGTSGAAYLVLGKVGYIAKGLSIAVVGGLFVLAGVDHNSADGGGLDQALQRVLQAPGGPVALVVIGLGFACYGLFCFARSRHLDR